MRILLAAALVLSLAVIVRLIIFHSNQRMAVGQHVELTIALFQQPQVKYRNQEFSYQYVQIILPQYPTYSYGDALKLSGVITEHTITSSSGERVIIHQLKYPEVKQIDSPWWLRVSSLIRKRIISGIVQVLPQNEATLLLGITLGVREEFDPKVYDLMRQTGVLHVVAASGSNVTLLAGVILVVLERFVKRKLSILFTGMIILWYAVLAGLDPSILRASLMALVAFSAQLLGRQNISFWALFVVASGMVLLDPALISSVSFQLSVTATLGIVLIKPLFDTAKVFTKVPVVHDDLTTTLAAQWGSLPIMVWRFGALSPLSMFVNVGVLWMVAPLMILGLMASLASLVWIGFIYPFAWVAYPLLWLFLECIELVSRLTQQVTLVHVPWTLYISYYLISLSSFLFLRQKKYAS